MNLTPLILSGSRSYAFVLVDCFHMLPFRTQLEMLSGCQSATRPYPVANLVFIDSFLEAAAAFAEHCVLGRYPMPLGGFGNQRNQFLGSLNEDDLALWL